MPGSAANQRPNRWMTARLILAAAASSLFQTSMGIALSSYRTAQGEERFLVIPGDDVQITYPTAGIPPEGASATVTVVDLYESKMSEYDSQFVFVPLRRLQELRNMINLQSGVGRFTSIQIKVKEGVDQETVDAVREVAGAVEAMRGPELGVLLITHYNRILQYLTPDRIHVMIGGRIVRSGGPELADELEATGYAGLMAELGIEPEPDGDEDEDDFLAGL